MTEKRMTQRKRATIRQRKAQELIQAVLDGDDERAKQLDQELGGKLAAHGHWKEKP